MTLTMFVGVVAQYQPVLILVTECHNSHKHSQNPLTTLNTMNRMKLKMELFVATTVQTHNKFQLK